MRDERCTCDHLRSSHADTVAPGHGPCEAPERADGRGPCRCGRFTWAGWSGIEPAAVAPLACCTFHRAGGVPALSCGGDIPGLPAYDELVAQGFPRWEPEPAPVAPPLAEAPAPCCAESRAYRAAYAAGWSASAVKGALWHLGRLVPVLEALEAAGGPVGDLPGALWYARRAVQILTDSVRVTDAECPSCAGNAVAREVRS